MRLIVEQAEGRVPVTVVHLEGALDASNFEELIARARELYSSGTRHMVLDLAGMSYMGSSGLVALHSIALLLRGEEPPDPEHGWQAFHAIDRQRGRGAEAHLRLLNPQPKIAQMLQLTGMTEFFQIHTDLQAAIASF